MQILDDNLIYILIEGEEVAFMERVINKLKSEGKLSPVELEVIDVGGSGNFNSIAKIIYRKSELHKSVPVIAISDKDFRSQSQVDSQSHKNDVQLIKDRATRIIYWKRHELENFFLEETETIANILNQIPTQKLKDKPSKKGTAKILTKELLDQWLQQYFKDSLRKELVECLRFRFREKANTRLNLEKLNTENLNSLSLEELEIWFRKQIARTARECRSNIRDQKGILIEKLQEISWRSWVNDPDTIDFDQAKKVFRGKEALIWLVGKAINELSIRDLNSKVFIQQMLLPELENNSNALIVQEISSMLRSYFQSANTLQQSSSSQVS